MLAEYDDSSLITLYTRGEELISQERNGEKSYYLYDGFDSVRMLTDSEGVVTDTYTFDAFGNLTASTGETENNYLYRGEQYDSFTGLYYLRARYMNPTTGTFISMDEYAGSIFEPVSLHKYLYANANPVMYTDPTGYFSLGELNVSIGIQNVLMSSVQGACMGTMLGGIFGSVFTWLRGGTSEQIQQAFVDGMAAGFLGGLCFGGLGALATSYWQAQLLLSMFQFAGGYFAFNAAVQDFANGDWIAGILSFGLGIYAAYSSANSADAARWMRNNPGYYGPNSIWENGQQALENANVDKFTIKNKHLNSSGGNWNKFNVPTESQAKAIVKNATNNGEIVSISFNGYGTNGQYSYKAIIETGHVIGTRGETSLEICYDELGNVWTVFPIRS